MSLQLHLFIADLGGQLVAKPVLLQGNPSRSRAEMHSHKFGKFQMFSNGSSLSPVDVFCCLDLLAAGVPQLFVGADNTLRAFDRGTGYQKWVISFETPPVGAFSAYGDGK